MTLLPVFGVRLKEDPVIEAKYREILRLSGDFCNSMLVYGNDAFNICTELRKGKERQSDHVLFSLMRHNIAFLDCIKVLLSNGCVEGCDPLLRSMIEANLKIMHVTEERHELRALSLKLSIGMAIIKKYRKGDLSQPQGREYEKELAGDAFLPGILKNLPPGLNDRADQLLQRIKNDPTFAPIFAEWSRVKQRYYSGSKDPEWYSLFGGATPSRNMRELAKHFHWISVYESYYKGLSESVHAGNVLQRYATADDCIQPLRYPLGLASLLLKLFTLFLIGIQKLGVFYKPEMEEQVSGFAVRVLHPEIERLVKRIEKDLGEFT